MRLVEVDGVDAHQLAALVAVEHVEVVFLAFAFFVMFLDRTAGGGVVARDGEAYHRAVGERERTLDEAFAEGATAHDYAAVVILQCSGEDFRGRGGILVDHHHYGTVEKRTAILGIEILRVGATAFGEYHRRAVGKQLRGYFHGGLHVASAVAFEVEDKFLHAEFFQLHDSLGHFFAGFLGKARQRDVAHLGGDHV